MRAMTIQEIRNLAVGDWVWIIDCDLRKGKYRQLVGVDNEHDGCRFTFTSSYRQKGYHRHVSNYGKTWLAWKNKEQAEAKDEIVELPNDVQTVLLRTIVYKTKFARTDYFARFEARDDFGQPQIMSIDEQFYRTVIRLLGIKSREEAEARLAELKGEKL